MRFRALFAGMLLASVACQTEVVGNPTRIGGPAAALSAEGVDASAAAMLDLRPIRDELLATDQAYAAAGAATNLIESLVAPLGPDAVFIAPGPGFARGPDAARAVLSANPNNATSKWRWTAIRVDVSSDGQHGYTYGYAELELPNGAVLPGRYQAFWSKQPDGSWRMAAHRRSLRPAGDVSLTPPPGFETPTNKHRRYFPNTDIATEQQAIAGVDRAFSDLAQQVSLGEAFAAYVAPDGAQGGTMPAWSFGPEEVAASRPEPAGFFSWSPEIVDVAVSGDLGFSVGFVYQAGSVVGKYFTVWQKQDTGIWRYVVD